MAISPIYECCGFGCSNSWGKEKSIRFGERCSNGASRALWYSRRASTQSCSIGEPKQENYWEHNHSEKKETAANRKTDTALHFWKVLETGGESPKHETQYLLAVTVVKIFETIRRSPAFEGLAGPFSARPRTHTISAEGSSFIALSSARIPAEIVRVGPTRT